MHEKTISPFLTTLVLFTLSCNGGTPPVTPVPTRTSAPVAPAAATKTMVIEKGVVDETPQSGTWLMCFMANAEGGSSATFNVPNRTYSGDGITIDMNIEIPNVTDGQKINSESTWTMTKQVSAETLPKTKAMGSFECQVLALNIIHSTTGNTPFFGAQNRQNV